MANSMETGVKRVHIQSAEGQIPQQMMSQYTPQEKVASSYSLTMGSSANVYVADMDGFAKAGINVNASPSHDYTLSVSYSPDAAFSMQTAAGTKTGASFSKWLPPIECVTQYLIISITNNDAATRTYDVWVRKWN
jgi:hypothetical protein